MTLGHLYNDQEELFEEKTGIKKFSDTVHLIFKNQFITKSKEYFVPIFYTRCLRPVFQGVDNPLGG